VLESRFIRRFMPFNCSYSKATRGSACLGDGGFSILSPCELPVKQLTSIKINGTKDFGMLVQGRMNGRINIADKCSKALAVVPPTSRRRLPRRWRQISYAPSILSMLRFRRSRWPTHRCKHGKTSVPRRQLMVTTQSTTSIATDGLQHLSEDVATG
jgi:hypothetical protein